MKTAIAIIAALLLAGCEARYDAPATIKPADKHDRNLTRWGQPYTLDASAGPC